MEEAHPAEFDLTDLIARIRREIEDEVIGLILRPSRRASNDASAAVESGADAPMAAAA